jgi:hypothetical protein
MKWFQINLGDGVEAFAPRMKIHDRFFGYLLAHGTSNKYAVFSSSPLKTNGDVIFYFPPALATFAHSIGAVQECDQPVRDLVGLELASNPVDAWPLYYPDTSTE